MEDRPDWAFGLFTPEAVEAKRTYYMSLRTEKEEEQETKRLVREEARFYKPRATPHAKPERNVAIWKARKEEKTTLAALGQQHGLSRERIRQIVAKEDRRRARRAYFDELRKQKEEASRKKEQAMTIKITRDTLIKDLEASTRLRFSFINAKHFAGAPMSSGFFGDLGEKHNWDPNEPATVGDFMNASEAELLRIPNFGRKSLNDWKKIVRLVENPDDPEVEEKIAEHKAITEIRATLKHIAGAHNALATHYVRLADIIAPLSQEKDGE